MFSSLKKNKIQKHLNYAFYSFLINNFKKTFVNLANDKNFLKKKILLHPEYYDFYNQKYKTDDWTNLTNNIIKYIPIKLYKKKFNPIFFITESIKDYFSDYELFEFENPVVHVKDNFDSLFIPENHSSRSKSDTYYVNKTHLLRCHTSAHQSDCLKKLKNQKFICIADVYRRDVIDFSHFPVFHQCEVFNILHESQFPKNIKIIDKQRASSTNERQKEYTLEATQFTEKILKNTVEGFLKKILNDEIKMRWIPAEFPFTHPSYELEIFYNNKWVELLGCGIVKKEILENENINDKIAFAIGFGLERIAMIKYLIPDIRLLWSKDSSFLIQFENKKFTDKIKFKPISKYGSSKKDLSFWIKDDVDWCENDFYDLARELGGEFIEQVKLIDAYVNENNRKSNCFRIVYRSNERTLKRDEVLDLHEKIKKRLVEKYDFELR